jgi:hypothetical protein
VSLYNGVDESMAKEKWCPSQRIRRLVLEKCGLPDLLRKLSG